MKYLCSIACGLLMVTCQNNIEDHLNKAKFLLKTNKTTEAIDILNKIILSSPNNALVFNVRGVAYLEQKDYANALLDFGKAIELDSKNYQPFFNRATIYGEKGEWQNALDDCKKAAMLQPDTLEIFVKRGMIYAALHYNEAAMADFSYVLRRDTKHRNALYNRGNLFFQEKSIEKAVADFENSVKTDPFFGKGFYALGITTLALGKKEAGCIALKQAQKLSYADATNAIETYCK